jgi:hypothetical protein
LRESVACKEFDQGIIWVIFDMEDKLKWSEEAEEDKCTTFAKYQTDHHQRQESFPASRVG